MSVAPAPLSSAGAPVAHHAATPGTEGVWWWRTSSTVRAADLALLSAAERERAAAMGHAGHAGEYVSCRAQVRRLLAHLLGTAPDAVRLVRRPCPGCGASGHGPPAVDRPGRGREISISHSAGMGVLAVAGVPVGVDVERARTLRTDDLASRVLSPSEARHLRSLAGPEERTRAFLRCWTRKESVLKGLGIGITDDLTEIGTHPWSDGPVEIAARGTTWSVRGLPVPDGWQASVALLVAPAAPRVGRAPLPPSSTTVRGTT